MFTCVPGVSYSRQFRSLLLCLCDVFRVLSNSLWLLILKTQNGQQQNFTFTQSLDTILNMKTRIAESHDMLWLLPKECCCSNTSWSIYYRGGGQAGWLQTTHRKTTYTHSQPGNCSTYSPCPTYGFHLFHCSSYFLKPPINISNPTPKKHTHKI